MKTCTRCILPSNYRNIRFDADGVCNYCRTYEELRPRLTDFEHLRTLFESRLNRYRGRFQYDVLVGISGGKDSSYLVYTLKKDYGLRVLAYTSDNGFMKDFPRRNIKRVVEKLKVDHFFYRPNWEIRREYFRGATIRLGFPCIGCSQPGIALRHKIAFERGIPFVIHGRSRQQMFRELLPGSLDRSIPFIHYNLSPYSVEDVRATYLRYLEWVKYFMGWIIPRSENRKKIEEEFFPDLEHFRQADLVPETLAFFLYHPYDEERMKRILEEKVGWERPEGDDILSHHDCEIHDAASYIHHRCLGYPLLASELSVAIREGQITREEALARLQREDALWEWPEESMGILGERLGLSEKAIRQVIRRNRLKHKLLRLGLKARSLFRHPVLDLFGE